MTTKDLEREIEDLLDKFDGSDYKWVSQRIVELIEADRKELEAENDRLKRLETELGKVLKNLAKAEVKRKDEEAKRG